MKKSLPSYVRKIMAMLLAEDFAAYVVGGAVRDICRGRRPYDYDIATDARPDDVVRLAQMRGIKTVPNLGHNFGVVLLYLEGKNVEVATFRGEKYGDDSHRPESVNFVDSLEEDLSRRDFTVNAMAMDIDGDITDLFGSLDDIKAKRLRCVGDPTERFSEDALRMFRAVRFCAQLGYTAEESMVSAIKDSLYRAEGLSLERVKNELEKLLAAGTAARGLDMLLQSGLCSVSVSVKAGAEIRKVTVLPELGSVADWRRIDMLPAKKELRWAFLLRGLDAATVLQRFMYNGKFIKKVGWLSTNIDRYMRLREDDIYSWVFEEASGGAFYDNHEMVRGFADLCTLGSVCGRDELADKLLVAARKMPVHTKDLALKGVDLEGIADKESIGKVLQKLLSKVQKGEAENEKEALMKCI